MVCHGNCSHRMQSLWKSSCFLHWGRVGGQWTLLSLFWFWIVMLVFTDRHQCEESYRITGGQATLFICKHDYPIEGFNGVQTGTASCIEIGWGLCCPGPALLTSAYEFMSQAFPHHPLKQQLQDHPCDCCPLSPKYIVDLGLSHPGLMHLYTWNNVPCHPTLSTQQALIECVNHL